jgi:hypothetical protein
MDQQAHNQAPASMVEPNIDPVVLPDVATEPHPSAHVAPLPTQSASPGESGRLQEVLPEIAGQLDRDGQ